MEDGLLPRLVVEQEYRPRRSFSEKRERGFGLLIVRINNLLVPHKSDLISNSIVESIKLI